jgi:hypothetical protein
MQQAHMNLVQPSPAFAVVATRAGRDHVRPHMLPAQVLGQDMVDGQGGVTAAAILAGIIIASKDFASSQFHAWARPMDHVLQADHGGSRQQLVDGVDVTAPVDYHGCLFCQDQPDGSSQGANIDRLEIRI